ncbi:hypothetical protein RND81_07G013400 [Saponaria officinalis]|uniref:Biotin carboxyl carrier protein of acetyl-CoA carboxylase n=1 Tax=Saponaria officinalis TaxID=3572 RepID=A0AAW1JL33_SAPOF
MATFSATSSPNVAVKIPTTSRIFHQSHHKFVFPVSPKPKLRISFSKPHSSRAVTVKAQLNKAAVEGPNNAPAKSEAKPGLPVQETIIDEGSSATGLASEESISDFISQVADLVKLVDSRDIMELKLKQLDCEILIRKKEAVAPTQTPPPYVMMQPPQPMSPPASSAPPPSPVRALPAPTPVAPAVKPPSSSAPHLLSPMAGTFYRCPGPGEPPFVKVGDKVQKGQVLCIIEAMKLMNEIQAEQAGTIVEIIAEDGKPVSRDSPLFAIQP